MTDASPLALAAGSYLLAVNVVTLLVYRHDALHRVRAGTNIAVWKMLALPVAGGWLGAGLANSFYNTAYRRSFYKDWPRLTLWPPTCAVAHTGAALYLLWGTPWLDDAMRRYADRTGVIGVAFAAMSVVGFFFYALVVILDRQRKNNRERSNGWDRAMALVVLFGGAVGVVFAKVLFGLVGLRFTLYVSWRWFYRDLARLTIGPWSYLLAAAQLSGFYYLFWAA